jgi:hypothetical protein
MDRSHAVASVVGAVAGLAGVLALAQCGVNGSSGGGSSAVEEAGVDAPVMSPDATSDSTVDSGVGVDSGSQDVTAFESSVDARAHDAASDSSISDSGPAPVFDAGVPGSGDSGCVPLPTGALSWWRAEGDFVESLDVNDGTPVGNVGFTSGVGRAFLFDGSDWVQATSATLPTGGSDRTLELWARVDASPATESFFAGYGSFGNDNETYQLGLGADGIFFSQWGTQISGPQWGNYGTWHHVAVTTASGVTTLYVDGAVAGTGALTIDTPPSTSVYMGRIPDPNGSDRRLVGAVDEVTLYGRALSASEIAAVYAAGAAGKCCPDATRACGDRCQCASSATCVAGACTCPSGTTVCPGACTDVSTDPNNCGTCGTVCPTHATCAAGACVCPSGDMACGTACVDTATDPNNCGTCGTVCASAETCVSGQCVCPSGRTSCSGQCTDTTSDRHNCGACGTRCPGGTQCISSQCQPVTGSLYAECSPASTNPQTEPDAGTGGCLPPLSCIQVPTPDGGTCDGGPCPSVCTTYCNTLGCNHVVLLCGTRNAAGAQACSAVGGTCVRHSLPWGGCSGASCFEDCEP